MKIVSWLGIIALSSSTFAADPVLHLDYQNDGGNISVVNRGSATVTPRLGNAEEASVDTREGFAALRFNDKAKQFIELKGVNIDFDKAFTITALVNPERSKESMEIFSYGQDSKPGGVRLRWRAVKGGALALLSGNREEARHLQAEDAGFPVGKWSHVALVFDGADVKLYIDGEEVAARKKDDLVFNQPKSMPIVVGNYSGRKDAYPFKGLLGPVKVYQHALSQEEIREAAKR